MKSRAVGSEPWIDVLARLALFASASPPDLQAIAGFACELEIDAGRVLVREGQAADDMMVVLEGQAASTINDCSSTELGPGAVVGEAAVLGGAVGTETVTALTPMRLLVLPVRRLAEIPWQRP